MREQYQEGVRTGIENIDLKLVIDDVMDNTGAARVLMVLGVAGAITGLLASRLAKEIKPKGIREFVKTVGRSALVGGVGTVGLGIVGEQMCSEVMELVRKEQMRRTRLYIGV